MKISGVRAHAITKPDAGAAGAPFAAGWCLLELATDAGPVGRALCPTPARDAALGLAQALLRGQDPRAVATLWERLSAHAEGTAAASARASLDHACWDLKAQANQEPLWKTLGGARPRARAYASLRGAVESDEQLREWLGAITAKYAPAGGRLRLSGDPVTDARRLGVMQGLLERRHRPAELAADAGGMWPGEALRLIRRIERSIDLAWVKGVAAGGDFLGCRRVADRVRAAVCVGGDLSCERAFLPWLHHRAGNVIELDVHRLGITGALRVAEAAFGFELPVTLTAAPANIQIQLAAVMPNFLSTEVVDPVALSDPFAGDISFIEGCGVAGDLPGTGLVARRGPPAGDPGATERGP